eukprot:356503-Chlamydomonas_euryale.AAC.3
MRRSSCRRCARGVHERADSGAWSLEHCLAPPCQRMRLWRTASACACGALPAHALVARCQRMRLWRTASTGAARGVAFAQSSGGAQQTAHVRCDDKWDIIREDDKWDTIRNNDKWDTVRRTPPCRAKRYGRCGRDLPLLRHATPNPYVVH